jgi:hypothetical protein
MPKRHIHHWLLAPPEGRTSTGHCKVGKCRATREFTNYEPQVPMAERWSRLHAKRQRRAAPSKKIKKVAK